MTLIQASVAALVAAIFLGAVLVTADPNATLRATTGLLVISLIGMSLTFVGAGRREVTQVNVELRRHAVAAELSQRALEAPGIEALLEEAANLVGQALKVRYCAVVETAVGTGPTLRAGAHQPESSRGWSHASAQIGQGPYAYGFLSVWDKAQRIFSPDDLQVLETVAQILAVAIERARAADLERTQLAKITRQAFHDPLTDLPNRALFADRLEHAVARAEREQTPVALLFVDLDDFKSINDTFGHATGDKVLVKVASRLSAHLRDGDTAARLGGDEFAIILEGATDAEARDIARRMTEALHFPISIGGRDISVSASIGIANASAGRSVIGGADALVGRADAAMYAAKRRGKQR